MKLFDHSWSSWNISICLKIYRSCIHYCCPYSFAFCHLYFKRAMKFTTLLGLLQKMENSLENSPHWPTYQRRHLNTTWHIRSTGSTTRTRCAWRTRSGTRERSPPVEPSTHHHQVWNTTVLVILLLFLALLTLNVRAYVCIKLRHCSHLTSAFFFDLCR